MFCQDSGIALKIFELALKRYGMQADCVCEYINYMSRLNGKMLCRLVFEPHLWLFIVFPILVYFTAALRELEITTGFVLMYNTTTTV